MRLKAVVFDLDGTLIDSKVEYGNIVVRIRELLKAEGVPEDQLQERRKVYLVAQVGEKAILDFGVKPERVPHILRESERAMNEVELASVELSKPMRNLHETLEALRGRGLKIGIATRSCGEYAARSLELMKMGHLIDKTIARDGTQNPKPNPKHLLEVVECLGASSSDSLYVGDAPNDFLVSRGAGVPFVGYNRDPEQAKMLADAGCTLMVDDLIKLLPIVDAD